MRQFDPGFSWKRNVCDHPTYVQNLDSFSQYVYLLIKWGNWIESSLTIKLKVLWKKMDENTNTSDNSQGK